MLISCASNHIIAGKSASTFAPNATVTGQEAAKMLLVVAGYDPAKAGLTGAVGSEHHVLRWSGWSV